MNENIDGVHRIINFQEASKIEVSLRWNKKKRGQETELKILGIFQRKINIRNTYVYKIYEISNY